MQQLDATAGLGTTREIRALIPRAQERHAGAREAVLPVLTAVEEHGRQAVLDYTERFDGVRPAALRVPQEALETALERLDSAVRAALEESIRRARAVAAADKRTAVTTQLGPEATVTTRWLPVDRVGLYVPGGLAAYPSTVIMNAVPAQAAGVGSLALASPPGPDGLPNSTVMATAALLGITEVWAMGGAQAIAAFAYGFDDGEDLEPVNLITGPGNAFVAAAKSLVQSFVGVDAIAGPTEIIVLADDSATPAYVAADLISQAEHDPLAASVLVTDSPELAQAVQTEILDQVARTAHADRIRQALTGRQSAIILVRDLADGIRITNVYAGEHVQVMTRNAAQVAAQITNGGSIFVGDYAPVALGDYCSGSNHVLPTNGTAAFASALGVQSFLRGSQVIDYSAAALREVADHIETLAAAEDLPAHGAAIAVRRES